MQTTDYLGKTFYDTSRKRYMAKRLLYSTNDWALFATDNNQVIRIIKSEDCSVEFRHWMLYIQQSEYLKKAEKQVAYPCAVLSGLRDREVGYIFDFADPYILRELTDSVQNVKLFKWYYEQTGGISHRLKVGYCLAKALMSLHGLGILYPDLSPDSILIHHYEPGNPSNPDVRLLAVETMGSETHSPLSRGTALYADPIVLLGMGALSISSDSYAYAVVLFHLLTGFHPFIGNVAMGDSPDEQIRKLSRGEYDYICNEESDNRNEDFEDTMLTVLSEKMLHLFRRSFSNGKFDSNQRPGLEEYAAACLDSLGHLVSCINPACSKEYLGAITATCPFCTSQPARSITITAVRRVSSMAKFVMPDNLSGTLSDLPAVEETINTMIITKDTKFIPISFFIPEISSLKDRRCIELSFEIGDIIAIKNLLRNNSIYVGGRELSPYQPNGAEAKYKICAAIKDGIEIRFPLNFDFESNQLLSICEKPYGQIRIEWLIRIK